MRDDIQVVAVNDPFLDPAYMAYMLKYDSVHGRLAAEVTHDDTSFIVDGQKITVTSEKCASLLKVAVLALACCSTPWCK